MFIKLQLAGSVLHQINVSLGGGALEYKPTLISHVSEA